MSKEYLINKSAVEEEEYDEDNETLRESSAVIEKDCEDLTESDQIVKAYYQAD